MSCGCNDILSFDNFINEANNLEEKTGIKHIVYIRKVNSKEEFFVRTIDEINNIEGVEEYFLSDKTRKKFPVKSSKEVKIMDKKQTK